MLYLKSTLYVLMTLCVALPAKGATSDSIAANPASACPVRFSEVPSRVQSPELSGVKFVGNGVKEIHLLKPSSVGLFILRVESADSGTVYGSYGTADKVDTVEFPLTLGMKAAEWSTVAESPTREDSGVQPGFFRIVLRYLALPAKDKAEGRICVAISPAFELTLTLH